MVRKATLEGWIAALPRGAGCSLVITGGEMLRGDRTDTLGPSLARRLAAAGWCPREHRVTGDDPRVIGRAVREACEGSGLVLVTGGLGATGDDTTRAALARLARRPLLVVERHAREVRHRLDRRGAFAGPPATRRRAARAQARIPRGALALSNPLGLALPFAVRHRGSVIAALPGVPAEALAILETSVLPALEAAHPRRRAAAARTVDLRVFGISETEAERRARGAMGAAREVSLGLLPGRGEVVVHLEGRDEVLLRRIVSRVRRALGRACYGEGETSLADVVGRLLLDRGWTVALAESCTGGLVGSRLTRVPGISASFREAWVCYANEAKHERLGVPLATLRRHGAVSRPVAEAMARGARRRSGADLAVAVTGIAGPGGGGPGHPVGLVWFAMAGAGGVRVARRVFAGSREVVRRRAASTALDLLRRGILAAGTHARRGSRGSSPRGLTARSAAD